MPVFVGRAVPDRGALSSFAASSFSRGSESFASGPIGRNIRVVTEMLRAKRVERSKLGMESNAVAISRVFP